MLFVLNVSIFVAVPGRANRKIDGVTL